METGVASLPWDEGCIRMGAHKFFGPVEHFSNDGWRDLIAAGVVPLVVQ